MYTPFVYVIKLFDPKMNRLRWYVGSKYAQGCQHSDLWTTYFTSSNAVHKLIAEHSPKAFTVRISKTFTTKDEALAYEEALVRRCIKSGMKLKRELINGAIPNTGLPLTTGVSPTNKGKCYEDYLPPDRIEEIKAKLRLPKTEASKIKMVAKRRAGGSYDGGAKHPRARSFSLISPSGEVFNLNGNLKQKCEELALSWQALYHAINKGPIVIDRARYKNLTRLGPKFYNTIGWEIKSIRPS